MMKKCIHCECNRISFIDAVMTSSLISDEEHFNELDFSITDRRRLRHLKIELAKHALPQRCHVSVDHPYDFSAEVGHVVFVRKDLCHAEAALNQLRRES
jgi:hypothetical protein